MSDIADQTVIVAVSADVDASAAVVGTSPVRAPAHGSEASAVVASVGVLADRAPAQSPAEPVPDEDAAQVQARRRQFLAQLGEFRRSRVLVPLGTLPGGSGGEAPLTMDVGGVRWILAFTDEAALARYALARGEAERQWRYWGVWGAALLDAAVPTVAESGVPCGVLVNVADGEQGLVLPPVAGVVPEGVAVDGPESFAAQSGGMEEGA
ncbi:hypothetical protein [Streptomyces sp. NPDC058755]|uniref:hypothetical protein n=1 Tax=Streptomyces sp. NPDC058755 TaxID=3346624 RepID=UPI0036D1FBCD